VFITGGSAGIGAALAREAAARGAAVVAVARREARVQELARELQGQGAQAIGIRGDVTREGNLEHAVAVACDQLGGIDLAVANAGFGIRGQLAELGLGDYRRQFETNIMGVLATVYATLPKLHTRRGMLALVGSANGYLSVPGWSAYCMSKAAVRSLANCLRHELAPLGVSVTHVAPGFVKSEFRQVDNAGELHQNWGDPVPAWLALPTDKAARQVLNAVAKRRGEVILTQHARAAIALERHTPRLVSVALRASSGLLRAWSKRA
jgi:short-subunit dehydrogenase